MRCSHFAARQAARRRHRGAGSSSLGIEGAKQHAWRVQADALGATGHVSRLHAPRFLAELFSIARRMPLSAARAAELRKSAGGASIHNAGKELLRLFDDMAAGRAGTVGNSAAVGREINASVGSVGVGEWLATVRTYHEGTFQHCLLVTGVVGGFVERYVTNTAVAARLTTAAVLHDVGKAVVPLHILDKPSALTPAEFDAIKAHPSAGYDYLAKQPGVDPQVLDAVRHHHEALDGSGYPDGLRGPQIGLLTRILTVCDIYAALTEARAYKPARPPQEAISILVGMALDGKVDYQVVRQLAQVFDMSPPETLAEVRENLSSAAGTSQRLNGGRYQRPPSCQRPRRLTRRRPQPFYRRLVGRQENLDRQLRKRDVERRS